MELTAKLIQVQPIQKGMGKNGEWRKQNIILETEGMYPKKVCITIWGDKINESVLRVGNMLDVSFDIESREYNGNWYTDLRAWKIEAVGANMPSSPAAAPKFTADDDPTPAQPIDFSATEEDDLPF